MAGSDSSKCCSERQPNASQAAGSALDNTTRASRCEAWGDRQQADNEAQILDAIASEFKAALA